MHKQPDVQHFPPGVIIFKVTGSICFGLQWGSDSDYNKDIGARGEESFEFSCTVTTKQPELKDFEVSEKELHIPQNYFVNEDDA